MFSIQALVSKSAHCLRVPTGKSAQMINQQHTFTGASTKRTNLFSNVLGAPKTNHSRQPLMVETITRTSIKTTETREIFFPKLSDVKLSLNRQEKSDVVKLLEENGIEVQLSSVRDPIPLIQSADIQKALKLLQKEKVLVNALTMWKKEDGVFFELYWKKGLYLDNVIRELSQSSKENAAQSVPFCIQKCIEFVNKMKKQPDTDLGYYGLIVKK